MGCIDEYRTNGLRDIWSGGYQQMEIKCFFHLLGVCYSFQSQCFDK